MKLNAIQYWAASYTSPEIPDQLLGPTELAGLLQHYQHRVFSGAKLNRIYLAETEMT